jgi:hypothetical protein
MGSVAENSIPAAAEEAVVLSMEVSFEPLEVSVSSHPLERSSKLGDPQPDWMAMKPKELNAGAHVLPVRNFSIF